MKASEAVTGQTIRWRTAAGWVFEGVVNHVIDYGPNLAAYTSVTPTTVTLPTTGTVPYQGCDVLLLADAEVELVGEA